MIDFNNLKKISDYNLSNNENAEGYILIAKMGFEGYKRTFHWFVSYSTECLMGDGPYICGKDNIVESILFPSLEAVQEVIEEVKYQLNNNFPYYHVVGDIQCRKFQLSNCLEV